MKNCEVCGIKIKAKLEKKRFCGRACQLKKYFENPEKIKGRKEYNKGYRSNPENRKKLKEWRGKYLQKPEIKEKNRFLAVTRYGERRRKYWKEYGKRPEVRFKINEKDRTRRKIDEKYAIIGRLRRSINHAFTKYTGAGKIMGSKKYGIDWNKVIESLKPFPKNIKNYEIDHIIPLHSFNLEDNIEIKKAFDPSNLQWLTIEENRKKSGKIVDNKDHVKSSGGKRKSLINA